MCPRCLSALIVVFLFVLPLRAQKHTVSGYISDAKSGEKTGIRKLFISAPL